MEPLGITMKTEVPMVTPIQQTLPGLIQKIMIYMYLMREIGD